jgi:hypothetical protein
MPVSKSMHKNAGSMPSILIFALAATSLIQLIAASPSEQAAVCSVLPGVRKVQEDRQVTAPYLACTPINQRCAGDSTHAFFQWTACCSGECIEETTHGWGKFCIAFPDSTATPTSARDLSRSLVSATDAAPASSQVVLTSVNASCTPVNVRCQGAPGYAAIPWLGCCSGRCLAVPSMGWGKFCVEVSSSNIPHIATNTVSAIGASTTVQSANRSTRSFVDDYTSFNSSRWHFSGIWSNGEPFANGWMPNWYYVANKTLNLKLDSTPFDLPQIGGSGMRGTRLPYTGSELRSTGFYG